MKHVTTIAILALAAALPGCVANNQRLTIGNSVHLEGLEPEAAAPLPTSDTPLSHEPGALDQRNWASHEVLVPNHYVGHRPPMWRREIVMPTKTARQRGEYPSPMTALELNARTHGGQAVDTLLATPMGVAGDTIQLPFRAVRPGLAAKKASPRWGYDRSPIHLEEWRGEVAFENAETRLLMPPAPAPLPLNETPPNPSATTAEPQKTDGTGALP